MADRLPSIGTRAAGAATTRRALAEFDDGTRNAIGAAVAASLQKYTDRNGLGLPMEANILMATTRGP